MTREEAINELVEELRFINTESPGVSDYVVCARLLDRAKDYYVAEIQMIDLTELGRMVQNARA